MSSRSRAPRIIGYCLALVVMAGPAALAQRASPVLSLRMGDTVRVWTSSPAEQVGIVAATPADSLAIQRFDGRPFTVSLAALSHVDVRRGSRRSPIVVTLAILGGATAGLIIGGFSGAAIGEGGGCDGDFCELEGFAVGAGVGILAGGIVGGILGSRYRAPRWRQVYPDRGAGTP